ncbi:hypothetical protein BKA70DRAFT_754560 [Coprinopsis sp. MPI-PUGE-AT-0042]|nr:hypothetical protein BKA70DRAFT_754560 [Coprinopsis sp. MPI-PUGE-AT-0042]
MYWLSVSRKGAFTSYVVTEVAWCWFLWIMWIATAGSSTWVNLFSGSVASEAQAFEAFAFINWFALLFYTTTLFVVAIISHSKGHSAVWTSAVKDFDFNSAVSQSAIPAVGPQGYRSNCHVPTAILPPSAAHAATTASCSPGWLCATGCLHSSAHRVWLRGTTSRYSSASTRCHGLK